MTTIKKYLLKTCDLTTLKSIAIHGYANGIHEFIYSTETEAFHYRFENEIWALLHEKAEGMDITILELIAQFSGQKDIGSMTQLKNLLCWFAIKEIANRIITNKKRSNNKC